MPTIDLTDDEFAAVTAAVRRTIEDDRFTHAPRLDPLRAALGKFEAANGDRDLKADRPKKGQNASPKGTPTTSKPTPDPKAPPPAKADKRARR